MTEVVLLDSATLRPDPSVHPPPCPTLGPLLLFHLLVRHDQSWGYLAGPTRQDMQAQSDPTADARTTGLPGDTVGPDKYNPNVEAVLTKRGVSPPPPPCLLNAYPHSVQCLGYAVVQCGVRGLMGCGGWGVCRVAVLCRSV